MQCYSHTNIYPFKLFPKKEFSRINFEPITVFYGKNGSGKSTHFQMDSLEDYEELRQHNAAKRQTKSAFTAKRLPKELDGRSNGESAFFYFTRPIDENALYLLDEPENSLSPGRQLELKKFIEDAVRDWTELECVQTYRVFFREYSD